MANKVSRARLVYQDGGAASSDFPLSNSDSFLPGNKIEILAGAIGQEQTIFTGLVIKQGLKIRENSAPQLIVDCRHDAIKMTRVKRSAYFLEQKDSEVIESILSEYELAAEVEASDAQHEQLVQYDVCDWDFCLMRAAVNGHLLFSDDNKISTKSPDLDVEPKVVLQFGSTIVELDAEVDSRSQHNGLKALVWDPVNQEVVEVEAADPGLDASGNLTAQSLAQVLGDKPSQVTSAAAIEAEAQSQIDANWFVSQLNQVGARIKCEGMTDVTAGNVVQLDGIGERYSGKAYVTAVRHDYDLVKGWKTTLQIGGVRQIYHDTLSESCADFDQNIASIQGLATGVVISNQDPAGEFRVQVALGTIEIGEQGVWARVATLDAGDGRGSFFRPEVGDEVVIGFLQDDPRTPVIIGMLHSSAKSAPLEPSDDNHEKGYVSRSEMKLLFDDDQKILTLETPSGNSVVLDEASSGIILTDQNGNSIAMTDSGIKIESSGVIELIASSDLKAESGTESKLAAGTQLTLEGAAGTALSSSAITEVKGSLVQIN